MDKEFQHQSNDNQTLDQDAKCKGITRNQETADQLLKCRCKDAERDKQARLLNQTSDIEYREYDTARKRLSRSNETEKQTLERRQNDAKRKREARAKSSASGSDEQLLQCRQKNAERQRKARSKKQEELQNLTQFIGRQDPNSFNEDNVKCHDTGQMNNKCSECGALMFKDECHDGSLCNNTAKFSLCCSKGDIKLPPIRDPPNELQKLLCGKTT